MIESIQIRIRIKDLSSHRSGADEKEPCAQFAVASVTSESDSHENRFKSLSNKILARMEGARYSTDAGMNLLWRQWTEALVDLNLPSAERTRAISIARSARGNCEEAPEMCRREFRRSVQKTLNILRKRGDLDTNP